LRGETKGFMFYTMIDRKKKKLRVMTGCHHHQDSWVKKKKGGLENWDSGTRRKTGTQFIADGERSSRKRISKVRALEYRGGKGTYSAAEDPRDF